MNKSSLLCYATVFVATSASAQPPQTETPQPQLTAPQFQLGVQPFVGLPVGVFGDQVGTSPGVAGGFSYRIAESSVWVGAEVGGIRYGSETRSVPLSLTLPDVLVDVNTNNSIVYTHGLVLILPSTGPVRPYVEGLVGVGCIATRISVAARNLTSTNFDDWMLNMGGGAGAFVELYAAALSD